MVKVIERQRENRLVFKKHWMVWQKFASGWRKKNKDFKKIKELKLYVF